MKHWLQEINVSGKQIPLSLRFEQREFNTGTCYTNAERLRSQIGEGEATQRSAMAETTNTFRQEG